MHWQKRAALATALWIVVRTRSERRTKPFDDTPEHDGLHPSLELLHRGLGRERARRFALEERCEACRRTFTNSAQQGRLRRHLELAHLVARWVVHRVAGLHLRKTSLGLGARQLERPCRRRNIPAGRRAPAGATHSGEQVGGAADRTRSDVATHCAVTRAPARASARAAARTAAAPRCESHHLRASLAWARRTARCAGAH